MKRFKILLLLCVIHFASASEQTLSVGGENTELECDSIWHENYENICHSSSLKILQPNLRLTAVTGDISESLLSDIKKVIIQDAQVHYLPDFSMLKNIFPKLKELRIWRSGLLELDKNQLELLYGIKVLNFYGNQIKSLPENVFNSCSIETLAFPKNQIETLPEKLLWNLPNLKKFWAWSNQIEAIPPRFFENNKKLKEIVVYDNKLSRIVVDFALIPKLKQFNLKKNTCIDTFYDKSKKSKENLKSLEELKSILYENCTSVEDKELSHALYVGNKPAVEL